LVSSRGKRDTYGGRVEIVRASQDMRSSVQEKKRRMRRRDWKGEKKAASSSKDGSKEIWEK